jgi:hypothetical protein
MNRSMCRVFRTVRACDGHHATARRSSARRHRQGPKAARTRGRSEAQRLARCRAQMQHRRRDGRRVVVIPSVITPRRRKPTSNAARLKPRFLDSTGHASTRERDLFTGNIFRTNGTGSSGRSGSPTSAFDAANTRRCSPPNMLSFNMKRQLKRRRQPWRERPLRTGAGPHRARAAGSLTPWFPALIAAPVPAQWAAKNAAHRAGVAPSRWNLRPENRLSAVLAAGPSPA